MNPVLRLPSIPSSPPPPTHTHARARAPQVDIGPHTYLLSPGDHFFVPHNCEYRLMNFSETPSEVAFVVIKPQPAGEGGAGGEEGAAR